MLPIPCLPFMNIIVLIGWRVEGK